MRIKVAFRTIVVAGIGTALASLLFVTPARSADPHKVPAGTDVPGGYALVSHDELQKLVHDEVARQLRDLVEQEQRKMSAEARLNSMRVTVSTLRSQVALYCLQHNDERPTIEQMADGFKQLRLLTDARGTQVAFTSKGQAYGPYLQSPPPNPFTGRTRVVAAGKPTGDAGWTYDQATGLVKAILPRQFEEKLKNTADIRDVEFAGAN